MNWKTLFVVGLKKLRDWPRDRRMLISTILIPTVVTAVMLLGMGETRSKVTNSPRKDVPAVMVPLWPLYGIGPLPLMFVQ